MAGLVPPAEPKPLLRGEGPAIHEGLDKKDVDARGKPGPNEERVALKRLLWIPLRL
jgi:hypothetical protein